MQEHPPCSKCGYLGFASDLDYTEAQLLAYRKEVIEMCAKHAEGHYGDGHRLADELRGLK